MALKEIPFPGSEDLVMDEQEPGATPEVQASVEPLVGEDAPRIVGRRLVETAESMARKQRQISVSEFFSKNRHLLGFDNPKRALLTAVKEAVDNSLDACEEAGILPEIQVELEDLGEDRFRAMVEDNGPGIVKAQVPNIFGKLLYGSKFHRLKMSRGQQGIGISAAGMYGLITTGRPMEIVTRVSEKKPAYSVSLRIDTKKNKAELLDEQEVEWTRPHGTKVTIYFEGRYQKGRQSVDEFLRQVAISNPHLNLHYRAPDGEITTYLRSVDELPPPTAEIKPHPRGVELGILQAMLRDSATRTISAFLQEEFSRVSKRVAEEMCERAEISPKAWTTRITREKLEDLMKAMAATKIHNPPTNCVAPIGEEQLVKGLSSVVQADFYASTTRPPSVYRGNPFIIEAALAYGGDQPGDQQARLLRFANRVPLLYQQGACACSAAATEVNWRSYKLTQPRSSVPVAPLTIVLHMASVWVPFTSESKEAIAGYQEIEDEMVKALQECGRKLRIYLSAQRRGVEQDKKHKYIATYLPHIALGLRELLDLDDKRERSVLDELDRILAGVRD